MNQTRQGLQFRGFARRQAIFEKIMNNVRICPVTGCWIWQGSTSGHGRGGGYPRMYLDGQTVAVHRVLFTNCYGYIPGKKQIDHVCGNRLCLNLDHLEMVTHQENQRRRVLSPQARMALLPTAEVIC